MPYVPSRKTDGKSTDREVLDKHVEALAESVARTISNNLSTIETYKGVFFEIADTLALLVSPKSTWRPTRATHASGLALAIYDVGEKYGYEGAFLGELNYSITRFIQRVPQIKVQSGEWAQELRYWLYAATVEALTCVAYQTKDLGIGVSGVFEDIKDEYKRRVNTAYEAEQILKSGDCYDAPYYTRLVEVVNEAGTVIGHQEIMLKRGGATLHQDVLDYRIEVRRK